MRMSSVANGKIVDGSAAVQAPGDRSKQHANASAMPLLPVQPGEMAASPEKIARRRKAVPTATATAHGPAPPPTALPDLTPY